MKKIFLITLSVVFLSGLVSCGEKEKIKINDISKKEMHEKNVSLFLICERYLVYYLNLIYPTEQFIMLTSDFLEFK